MGGRPADNWLEGDEKISTRCMSNPAAHGRLRDIPANVPATRQSQRRGNYMSKVRILAGTRKGAFILESDAARDKWEVRGPFFGGWEIYHFAGSPADPDRLYVSQTSSWFGQIIQRSDDGGRTWARPGLPAGEAEVDEQGMPRAESHIFKYDEAGAPLT